MDVVTFFFLSSGLFLGWTLGANNMSSVFGTAIGTKMISFKIAAIIACIFVVLGSVCSGSGVATTLESLGQINTLAGAFVTALAASVTILIMTKARIPISITQAMVGSIVGWSLYSKASLNVELLGQIIMAWFLSPFLAMLVAFLMMFAVKCYLKARPIPLLYRDAYTRTGLLIAGALSAYSLGANNIGNIMAPFMRSISLPSLMIGGNVILSSAQQLFFLGSLAICIGIFTFSKRVVQTVGQDMFKMSPIEAFIIVSSHAFVLFLFSSVSLNRFFDNLNISFPLVPLSSVGAIIGGVVGVSLTKKGQGLKLYALYRVMRAWVWTPIFSAIVCFLALFFMENVFGQKVL